MSFSEIKNENGYPALYMDGKRIAPLMYALTDQPSGRPDSEFAQKNIPYFNDLGINLISVCTSIDRDWKEDGTYDAAHPIECIKTVKKLHPNAKLHFRFNLTPPYWWMRKYPEELIKYYGIVSADTGRGRSATEKDKTNEIRASMVSERWIRDVKGVLKQFAKALKDSGLDKEVYSVQLAYGGYGEWHLYGRYYGAGAYESDYSAPMLRFFRKYLKKKYKTEAALCSAWGEKTTFETAQLATPDMRHALQDNNTYRYPEYSMRALDSLKCLQLGAPYAISKFAKCLKEAWGDGLLVGAFYGYYFACGDVFGRMLEPHLLFNDKNIDFLAAPNAYTANKRSGNAAFLRYCAESVRLNGKLFWNEMDQGYGIDKNKIAVMGSSAGAHLAALLSTYRQFVAEVGDEISKEAILPNAQILCYGVLSLVGDYAHKRSGICLLGDKKDELGASLSPVLIADEKTPQAFLWHTWADGSVPVENSLEYAKRLRAQGVPTELHIFPDGKHGLGLCAGEDKMRQYNAKWASLLLEWLHFIDFN